MIISNTKWALVVTRINFYFNSIRATETTEIRDISSTLRVFKDAEFVFGVVEVVVIGPSGGGMSSI